ncbi:hypothetical protein GCM10010495_29690 [Kitasatospora herbaricolor]|nr:hypothetical protein GCM10010495_29690 [Kitasatospora herbaricolor]
MPPPPSTRPRRTPSPAGTAAVLPSLVEACVTIGLPPLVSNGDSLRVPVPILRITGQ